MRGKVEKHGNDWRYTRGRFSVSFSFRGHTWHRATLDGSNAQCVIVPTLRARLRELRDGSIIEGAARARGVGRTLDRITLTAVITATEKRLAREVNDAEKTVFALRERLRIFRQYAARTKRRTR